MVTAELAVAIPAVVLVLVACLAGLSAAVDQVRCVDAARLGSRAAARGDSPERVRQLAQGGAPSAARVTLSHAGGLAVVTVQVQTGGWGGFLPAWTLTATARTPVEQAVSG
jgi:hypothetical protein